MFEAFSLNHSGHDRSPKLPDALDAAGRAPDIAVQIVNVQDETAYDTSTCDLAETIANNLFDELGAAGIQAFKTSTGKLRKKKSFILRLLTKLGLAAPFCPEKRLEFSLFRLATRFEDRRVLMIIADGANADHLLTPFLYDEAARLDIEILLLSLDVRPSGTTAVLRQRRFHIQISDVAGLSHQVLTSLLCRGILRHTQ